MILHRIAEYCDNKNEGFVDTKIEGVMAHKSQIQNFTEQWVRGIITRVTYIKSDLYNKFEKNYDRVDTISKDEQTVFIIYKVR